MSNGDGEPHEDGETALSSEIAVEENWIATRHLHDKRVEVFEARETAGQ